MAANDDDISSMNSNEFAGFMAMLVLMGTIASFMLVRLFHNCCVQYHVDEVKEVYGIEDDDLEMKELVEEHKYWQTSTSRVLLPAGC